MREIPQYISQLQTGSLPQVQYTNAPSQLLSGLSGFASDVSSGLIESQRNSEKLKYQILIDKTVNEYASNSGNDIPLFQSKVDGFSKGLLKEAPSYLRDDLELRIYTTSAPKLESMYKTNKQIRESDLKLASLTRIRQAHNTIKNNVVMMRDADAAQRVASGREVQLALKDITESYMSRDEDGKLLFSEETIDKELASAKDYIISEDAKQWFKSQPNKLEAIEQWRSGAVSLSLPNIAGETTLEEIPDEQIFSAMIERESAGKQFAADGSPLQSNKGAIGIAQVMPDTAEEAAKLAGVPFDAERYLTDPSYNKALGNAYFKKQVDDFGSKSLAVMAYNAGPGAVSDFMNGTNKSKKNPNGIKLGDPRKGEISIEEFVQKFPFKETREYVEAVSINSGLAVVNSRAALSPDVIEKLDKEIVTDYTADLKLERELMRREKDASKRLADTQFVEHTKRLQDRDNPLTLEELDLYKSIYIDGDKEKEYLAMRSEIISGVPETEDGATRNELFKLAASGKDAETLGLQAIADGRISYATYNQALQIKANVTGPTSNMLAYQLKAMEKTLYSPNSPLAHDSGAALTNAQAMYIESYNSFIEQNGRQPNFGEADKMRRDISNNFDIYGADAKSRLVSTKPAYIPASAIYNENMTMDKLRGEMLRYYENKYKGKILEGRQLKDLLKDDEEFQKDQRWIKGVEEIKSLSVTGE